jgi:cyanate permease
LINALGNVSAFLGPLAIGWSRDQTGEFSSSLAVMAIALFLGAVLMIITRNFYEIRRGEGMESPRHKVVQPKVG